MPRCIFCLETLDVTPGANHTKVPSEEHIIPNALGGSRACSTMDVCRECNSTLGDTVDSGLINNPVVAMIRHRFGTAGYSGTVPDIVLPSRSVDSGEPARITFRSDTTVDVRHEPVVIRDKKADFEEILVAGHPEDVERIFQGIVVKAFAGATLKKDAALAALDTALANAVPELNNLYKVPVDIDVDKIYRGLVKIAFEFAHKVLGWKWTDSNDAVLLRKIARGLGTKADLRLVLQGISEGFRRKLPLADSAMANHHVLAFMPGQQHMVFVSLFGEPLLTVGVKLAANLDLLAEDMRPDQDMLVSIDPTTRLATWVSMKELAAHTRR